MPIDRVFEFLERGDRAWVVTVLLIALQLVTAWRVARASLYPLRRGTAALRKALALAARADSPAAAVHDTPPQVHNAYHAVYAPKRDEEVLEPREAFSPERLMPREYNHRLDSAAPGLFTGLGIAGTFVGLLMAFSRIDPAHSENSIRPLVAGMSTAFWNSLAGVILALIWTYYSRNVRHNFDRTCFDLALKVESRFGRPSSGSQILTKFSALQEALAEGLTDLSRSVVGLQGATANSSRELLEKLAPSIEQSFKALVDTPFERLGSTVAAYEASVERVNRQHAETISALSASVAMLSEAKLGLAETLTTAGECVRQFEGSVERMRTNVDCATEVVEASRRAADVLGKTANTIQSVGERHGQLASALGGAVTELRSTSGTLDGVAKGFEAAADRLAATVATIESISGETARASVAAVRAELQEAINGVAASLTAFGETGARAYEVSTGRVIEVVDEKMSDLTDRLSAELSTLAARLPESMEDLTSATREVRLQVTKAVRTLEEAVRQLDVGTRKSLSAQLTEYDTLLAKAVDHFSGTLSQWDGKVDKLHDVSKELRVALSSARKGDIAAGMALPGSGPVEGVRA